MMAPKNRKTPMKENPGGSGPCLSCIWPIYLRSGGSSMVGEPRRAARLRPFDCTQGRLSRDSRGGCRYVSMSAPEAGAVVGHGQDEENKQEEYGRNDDQL
jgi:cell division septal protein FtsQ